MDREKIFAHKHLDPQCVEEGCMSLFLEEARKERDELQASFDLRWKADMRAIARWRVANPGNELVLPDHADLCVWLLKERDKSQEFVDAAKDVCSGTEKLRATVLHFTHVIVEQDNELRLENKKLKNYVTEILATIVSVHGPKGCACIKDLPGDNYTCTGHQKLMAIAREALKEHA